jgi:hypothetical protein
MKRQLSRFGLAFPTAAPFTSGPLPPPAVWAPATVTVATAAPASRAATEIEALRER